MHTDDVYLIFAVAAFAAAAVVLSVFVCWLNRRRGCIVTYDSIPLPEIGPFDGRDVSCTCLDSCVKHERQPESMVIGSNFVHVVNSKVPKVQIPLYSVNAGGSLTKYLGVAVRIDDWLVTPYHVIVSQEVVACLVQRPGLEAEALKMKTSDFEQIEGDLAAVRQTEAFFSRLGLTKASLAPIDGEMIVSVCSASKDPEMSFGTLVNDSQVFGGVVFRGSTRGGFSGAPYMMGKQIAGIHLGGGIMNYGVSATYIHALLRKPEDTAEWLERVRRKRGPLKFQRSKFNPDEAIVFVGGRYHNVDLSLLEGDLEEDEVVPHRVMVEEVNMSENFPPQYRDLAEPVVQTINAISAELQSKNVQPAESISAEEAQAFLVRHAELMSQLDERIILLQSLQDSVANRYREVEKLLLQTPKQEAGREILVAENEKLKKELSEIKRLKTDVNVEASSLKAVPKGIRVAKAKSEGATILDKMTASGFSVDAVIRALIDQGLVVKVVDGSVKSAVTTPVQEDQKPCGSKTKQ